MGIRITEGSRVADIYFFLEKAGAQFSAKPKCEFSLRVL